MRMRHAAAISIALIVLISLMLSFASPAGAYQHVVNGSFESGMQGWLSTGPTSVTDETAADGARSARVSPQSSMVELRQDVVAALAAGAYAVSASVRTDAAGATAHLILEASVAPFTTSVLLAPDAWTRVTLETQLAAPSTARVRILVDGVADALVFIDDVRIEGAPPVTFTPTPTQAAPTPEVSVAASGTPTTPTATPTPAAVDEIASHLRNASFEELDGAGLPLAWQKYGGALSADAPQVRSGARAARLTSDTDSTKWVFQTVLVAPGATYDFGAWLLHDDPGVRAAFIRVSWYASEDGSGSAIDSVDSAWALEAPSSQFRALSTGPVTAPSSARSAKLRVMLAPRSAAPASIVVDDAWFRPAEPLPTATASTGDAAESDVAGAAVTERRVSAVRGSKRRGSTGGSERIDVEPVAPPGAMLINEVLYDSTGDVEDADGEWIEFYNRGAEPVSLGGWSIQDNARRTMLPDLVVQPGTYAIVSASTAFNEQYPDFVGTWGSVDGRLGNGLGNDGDTLELIAPDGTLADAISWGDDYTVLDPSIGDVPAGHSIERRTPAHDTDTSDDFVDNHAPSPGAPLPPLEDIDGGAGRGTEIRILDGDSEPSHGWVPWALVAASGAALIGAIGWRALEALRARTPAA